MTENGLIFEAIPYRNGMALIHLFLKLWSLGNRNLMTVSFFALHLSIMQREGILKSRGKLYSLPCEK